MFLDTVLVLWIMKVLNCSYITFVTPLRLAILLRASYTLSTQLVLNVIGNSRNTQHKTVSIPRPEEFDKNRPHFFLRRKRNRRTAIFFFFNWITEMFFARNNFFNFFLTMTDCWDQEMLVNDAFDKIAHVLPRDTLG